MLHLELESAQQKMLDDDKFFRSGKQLTIFLHLHLIKEESRAMRLRGGTGMNKAGIST